MGEITRREFCAGAAAAGCAFLAGGAGAAVDDARYAVAILGDTHYDTEPESVYHSHYDESNKWAKIQHEEFRRNGEMWRERCPALVNASAALARALPTKFILQLGDLVQGDCDDVPTHKKMLADCIAKLRARYPAELPFLTVMGNHDFRGKGARAAYMEFAETFLRDELGKLCGAPPRAVRYPVIQFRVGPDAWIFCDFEMKNLDPVTEAVEAAADARHVFLVTHGPFTPSPASSFRWRLGGRSASDGTRDGLLRALSRRRAFVLAGHTHTTNFYHIENEHGAYSEAIVNSVWAKPELATAAPIHDSAEQYGCDEGIPQEKREDWRAATAAFKPGMKQYFYNRAAGHYRLGVSGKGVALAFYPGAAAKPAKIFKH